MLRITTVASCESLIVILVTVFFIIKAWKWTEETCPKCSYIIIWICQTSCDSFSFNTRCNCYFFWFNLGFICLYCIDGTERSIIKNRKVVTLYTRSTSHEKTIPVSEKFIFCAPYPVFHENKSRCFSLSKEN